MEGGNLNYKIFIDYAVPFDEKGSTCGTVRKVQWVREGSEPDEEKAKVEIRKIYMNGSDERVGKGYSFSTPEGPNELIIGMIRAGFGDTKEILKECRKREDFLNAANTINDEDDNTSDGEVFDMRDLLNGIDEDEELKDVV